MFSLLLLAAVTFATHVPSHSPGKDNIAPGTLMVADTRLVGNALGQRQQASSASVGVTPMDIDWQPDQSEGDEEYGGDDAETFVDQQDLLPPQPRRIAKAK